MNETRQQLERAIVGCVISPAYGDDVHPAIKAVTAGVSEEWFAESELAALFHVISNRVKDGSIETVDALAIAHEAHDLKNDKSYKRPLGELDYSTFLDYVAKLIEEGSSVAHLDWHINRLRSHHSLAVAKRGFAAAERIWDANPSGAMAKINEALTSASRVIMGEDTANRVAETCAKLEDDEHEAWHMRVDENGPKDLNWIPGYKLPWSPLTRLYLGVGGRLHIIAARPSVGKTMFAVNLARYWTDTKLKLVFNSLDMPPSDVIDRMRTEYSRVSIAKKRYTPSISDLERLKEASAWIRSSNTQVCETLYVEDFCLALQMKKAAGELDVAMVDYIQLLQSHSVDNSNEYERVSYVAEYLKRTANSLNVPIFALCQLNRKGAKEEGEEPSLTDLRGSGALEQAASTVLILHRDIEVCEMWKNNPPYWMYENQQYGRDHAAETIDAIWAILAKNQNGPVGRLPFVVHKPYFCAKLGDYDARPEEVSKGAGVTAKTVKNYTNCFTAFHRDWRHDSWEKSLDVAFVPESRAMVGTTTVNISPKRVILPEVVL